MTFVDSNVLFDLITKDPTWFDWSVRSLEEAARRGTLFINPVVYSDLCARYDTFEQVDDFLNRGGIELADIPRPALFLAAKAFRQYRSAGGTRTGVLPDFFIGAHAMAIGVPLITRDVARYRTYFPGVTLISPKLS